MICGYFQSKMSPLLNSYAVKEATKERQAILNFFMDLLKLCCKVHAKCFKILNCKEAWKSLKI